MVTGCGLGYGNSVPPESRKGDETWLLICSSHFGADNYLVLTNFEEIVTLFEKLTPGDEFILKCIELSQEEYNRLGSFDGFDGPSDSASLKGRATRKGTVTKPGK
jgi:hypothetical protein